MVFIKLLGVLALIAICNAYPYMIENEETLDQAQELLNHLKRDAMHAQIEKQAQMDRNAELEQEKQMSDRKRGLDSDIRSLEEELLHALEEETNGENINEAREFDKNYKDVMQETAKDHFAKCKEYTCKKGKKIPIDYKGFKSAIKATTSGGGKKPAPFNAAKTLEGSDLDSESPTGLVKLGPGDVMDIPFRSAMPVYEVCVWTFGVKTVTLSGSGVTKSITPYTSSEYFSFGCCDFKGAKLEGLHMEFDNGPPSYYVKRIYGVGCTK